jgi:hypothetical protein
MTASFPGTVKAFARQTDGVSTIDAVDVNAAYDEIEALETFLATHGATGEGGTLFTPATVTTTDDTPTVLYEQTLAAGAGVHLSGYVLAQVAGDAGDGLAVFGIAVTARNTGTVAVLSGAYSTGILGIYASAEAATWTIEPAGDGNALQLIVTGAAETTIVWAFTRGLISLVPG